MVGSADFIGMVDGHVIHGCRADIACEQKILLRLFIAELDDLFQRLIESLQAAGRLENTVVIVTSDHGESMFEHGRYVRNDRPWPE